MALKFNDTTVGHVPKFLSKTTYFFLKLGGDLVVKITGQRRYSRDLDQGGMELPGTYVFTSTDAEMHAKLEMLVKEAMGQYNNKIKEKEREKKIRKKNVNVILFSKKIELIKRKKTIEFSSNFPRMFLFSPNY